MTTLRTIPNPFADKTLAEFCELYGLTQSRALQEIEAGHLRATLVQGQYVVSFEADCSWAEARWAPPPYILQDGQSFDCEPNIFLAGPCLRDEAGTPKN